MSSLETALSAVCHGLGFAWLPDHLIAPALSGDELIFAWNERYVNQKRW